MRLLDNGCWRNDRKIISPEALDRAVDVARRLKQVRLQGAATGSPPLGCCCFCCCQCRWLVFILHRHQAAAAADINGVSVAALHQVAETRGASIRAVATSAMREAENREELRRRLRVRLSMTAAGGPRLRPRLLFRRPWLGAPDELLLHFCGLCLVAGGGGAGGGDHHGARGGPADLLWSPAGAVMSRMPLPLHCGSSSAAAAPVSSTLPQDPDDKQRI